MSPARCPACRECGRVLGTLSALRWYRCRACGIDFSRPRKVVSPPCQPSPASLSGRRIVNERAWRRGTHRTAVTRVVVAAAADNEGIRVARPRRKTP